MFSDLSTSEKNVLDLYIKAHNDRDYCEIDFNNDLKIYDSDYSITISLINKGYINGIINTGINGYQEISFDHSINGHILSNKILKYLQDLNR